MKKNCRLCKSKKISLAVNYKDSVPVDNFRKIGHLKIDLPNYNMDLYVCNKCGHAQILNVVDPEVLFGDYIYKSTSSPGLKKHFKSLYKEIIDKKLVDHNNSILDIGCNDGLLLENFQKYFKTFGVDPDKNSLKIAKKKGIKVFNSYINTKVSNDILKKYGKMDLVIATNVFSHSDDLEGFTKCVSNLLKEKSTFVFEVSYLKALLFEGVWDYVYHEHLAYHSIKPLNIFLKKFNLYLVDIKFIPVKGGSIRCYAKKSSKYLNETKIVKEIIKTEKYSGFYRKVSFDNLANNKINLQIKLNNNLKIKKGDLLASFGASATTTVLSQELNYASKISFIIDDNKERQNTLSPGYLIPVLGFNSIQKYKPKYIIISAWRFRDRILKKLKNYIDKGGIVIIPNPKIEVIKK